MKHCLKCGNEMEDKAQFCGNCGATAEMQEPAGENGQKKGKKNKITAIGLITTIVFMVIGRLVGGFIGENLGKSMSEKNQMNKIDAYIESMETYVPGSFTEHAYMSGHFGFQFAVDENWVMCSESELAPLSENLKESALSGGAASLEAEGIGEEMLAKWKESIYAEVEMAASYIADDMVAGEVSVGVYSGYGMDTLSSGEIITAMKEALLKASDDVRSGQEILAGEKYDSAKISLTVEDMDIVSEIFMREKDGMICMITCRAIAGYEDKMMASFKEQISRFPA